MKKSNFNFCALIICCSLFSSCASLTGSIGNMGDYLEDTGAAESSKTVAFVSDASQLVDAKAKQYEDISYELEYQIGRVAASEIIRQNKIIDNPYMSKYLNEICAVLTLNSDKPYLYKGYFVVVVDSPEINAISTPGGHIFISRGLLKCANSEDALAGIIAHELSHIQLNHSSKLITYVRDADARKKEKELQSSGIDVAKEAKKNISFADSFADILSNSGNPLLSVAGYLGGAALDESIDKGLDYEKEKVQKEIDQVLKDFMAGYHPEEQEYDADIYALQLMSQAGYNPYALVDMLYELKNNSTNSGTGWEKTHPAPSKRIKKVEAALNNRHYAGSDMNLRKKRFEEFQNWLY